MLDDMRTMLILTILLSADNARAGVDACGNLDITASSQCEIVTEGGCATMCTPISFQASCAADLYVTCDAMCTLTADVSCTGSCEASCSADCMVDPGSYECGVECQATCEGSCSGTCSGSANMGECMASCRATCSGECDASCTGTPPTATCDAKCMASCQGSCTADANLDCQATCQSGGFVDCTTTMMGGCTTQCATPSGALFCDGQYVDADNLVTCVDYLVNSLMIDVQGYADFMCTVGMCTAEAGASCSCRAGGADTRSGLSLLLFAIAGLFVMRRRR